MKLHERTRVVDEARAALTQFMIDLEEKYELTYGEMFSMLGDRIARLSMDLVRAERHSDDPNKRGDEA